MSIDERLDGELTAVLQGAPSVSSDPPLVARGSHTPLGAERYDRDLADIFAVQDEITEAVTIAVVPAIDRAEQQRAMRRPPDNLDAWAAYQRGLWHFDKATVEDYALAEKCFRQALNLDPSFADGYCGLPMVRIYAAAGFGSGDLADASNSMEPLARQAVSLDPKNAVARLCMSFVLFGRGDYDAALAETDRALALSPNLAAGYWLAPRRDIDAPIG